VGEDSIRIKTKTFSLWSIFACGGPRRKRATVFSSRPDPKSDLIYLRFYVYSDNEDSKKVSDRLNDRNNYKDRVDGWVDGWMDGSVGSEQKNSK